MASSLIAPVTTAFITYQVSAFGQEAVAGFGVASRLEGLAMMVLMALSAALTPFVGQNFGARQFERVQQGVHWSYRFSFGYGLIAAGVLALFSGTIAGFFTENPIARDTTLLHLRIVPISYLALGMSMTANSAFNAIGKPMPAMFVSLIRTILVYAPLALLFAKQFGLVGIFAAACVANFIAGSVGRAWFRYLFTRIVADNRAVPQS
jgi:Na+-driven multidrug efflux pump